MWVGFKNGKFSVWAANPISYLIGFGFIYLIASIYDFSPIAFRLFFDLIILSIILWITKQLKDQESKSRFFIRFIKGTIFFILLITVVPSFLWFIDKQAMIGFYKWFGWIFFIID